MSEEKRAGSPANRRVHPAPAPPHDGCRRHRAAHIHVDESASQTQAARLREDRLDRLGK